MFHWYWSLHISFFDTHPRATSKSENSWGKKNSYSTTLSVDFLIRFMSHTLSQKSTSSSLWFITTTARPQTRLSVEKRQCKVQTQGANWANTEAWSSQKVKRRKITKLVRTRFILGLNEKSLQLDRGQCKFQASINIYPRSHLAGGILSLVPQTECPLMSSCGHCKR